MRIKNFHTPDELEENLKQVLVELKSTILDNLEFKQAKLLTYWLNDWNEKFLTKENNFNPEDLIKYKKGNILKIHLGYNIGSEQGGLHYGLVVDNNNDKTSNVITIIPLRSLKKDEKIEDIDERFELYLGEALLTDKISYIENQLEKFEKKLEFLSPKTKDYILYTRKKMKAKKELDNLKKGSIAIVSQIRTISKLRIYEPIKSYHSLSKFELDSDKLKDIDKMIKKLFISN